MKDYDINGYDCFRLAWQADWGAGKMPALPKREFSAVGSNFNTYIYLTARVEKPLPGVEEVPRSRWTLFERAV